MRQSWAANTKCQSATLGHFGETGGDPEVEIESISGIVVKVEAGLSSHLSTTAWPTEEQLWTLSSRKRGLAIRFWRGGETSGVAWTTSTARTGWRTRRSGMSSSSGSRTRSSVGSMEINLLSAVPCLFLYL